jgi:hypothetical protein
MDFDEYQLNSEKPESGQFGDKKPNLMIEAT